MHIVARCIFYAIFILSFRHSTQVVMQMIVSSKLHLPFHRPIGDILPERQINRRRWCMVIILWYMCRVTDFTKCELALLRLPAPGLQGTWAKAYGLLLVSQIGCDELVTKEDLEPYFCHGRGVSHAEKTKRHSESVVSYFDQWISTLARFWYWNCRDTWWNGTKPGPSISPSPTLQPLSIADARRNSFSRPNNHNFDTLCERSCPGRRGS